jgi:O-antigen/teichoic acid export membrane protein
MRSLPQNMKKIVNLLGHGLFYTIAISIESIAPFILAPVLTHYLSVYEYGIWALFQSACALMRPLLGLGLDDFVRMRYHQHPRERMIGYLISVLIMCGALAIIACIGTWLFSDAISGIMQFPGDWIWAIVLCSWLHAMFYMLLAFYQFEGRRTRFAIIHLMQALGTLFLSVALVMSGWGWSGAALGKIIGLGCGVALAWFWITRLLPQAALKQFRLSYVRDLFMFGLRYLPNSIAAVLIMFSDRLILTNMLGLQAASLFAVATLFPMMLLIAIQGYIMGWQPWCYERLARHHESDRLDMALAAAVFFGGLPVGGLMLIACTGWLGPYIIDPQFSEAFDYVPALTMAIIAYGFYWFAQTILQFYQQLGALSWIASFAMILNIALNFILIEPMGTVGSAWATATAYGTAFVLTAIVAAVQLKRHYLIPLHKESARV